MNEPAKDKYSLVDLFAGAGGLSCGFEASGAFFVKAAFEKNKSARETFSRNHSVAADGLYEDVGEALLETNRDKLGQVDVVIGGPPCQGFSNANRQKNHAISRNNSLVKQFVKVVLHLQPKAFLMENVSMLRSDVHRFYVAEEDGNYIRKYGIPTQDCNLSLLKVGLGGDSNLNLEELKGIVSECLLVKNYLWSDKEYLAVNIVYKHRKNHTKLVATLNKNRQLLNSFARKLADKRGSCEIDRVDGLAGKAILSCYDDEGAVDYVGDAIEQAVLVQRMLSKAKEIFDNAIKVSEYAVVNNELCARVKSMAVLDYVTKILGADSEGYIIARDVLSAAKFGVPQKRMRYVILGVKKSLTDSVELPEGNIEEEHYHTVHDAISDLEDVPTTTNVNKGNIGVAMSAHQSDQTTLIELRDSNIVYNHVTTATTDIALQRFRAIEQGQNFHNLPEELKKNYSDARRTQNSIYLRLEYNKPCSTVVNVRKSMWIHPVLDRALSIREAARLQTFTDSFVFCGGKNEQYQQIGNAVPPMLAKALAERIRDYLDRSKKYARYSVAPLTHLIQGTLALADT